MAQPHAGVAALFLAILDRECADFLVRRDEMLVEQRRNGLALERFAFHDMAPVACRVTDREQNRFVLGSRALEGLGAPRIPVDRVARVLPQVGRSLALKSVHSTRFTWPGA